MQKAKTHLRCKKPLPRAGLCFVTLAFLLCVFSGCALGSDGVHAPGPEPEVTTVPAPTAPPLYSLAGRRTPIRLLLEEHTCGAYKVRYPSVYEEGAELLSFAVTKAFDAFARELTSQGLSGRLDFTVEYNDRGLLAIVITAYGSDGREQSRTAACFDCATASRIGLTACFGSGDESFRFALADTVTERLRAAGNSVISFLPPMDDDRLFWFDEEGLTLMYRKYEVCDAEAGMPEVFLSYEELEGYLNPDALLRRVPYFDAQ